VLAEVHKPGRLHRLWPRANLDRFARGEKLENIVLQT
jgi:hypothetical protein